MEYKPSFNYKNRIPVKNSDRAVVAKGFSNKKVKSKEKTKNIDKLIEKTKNKVFNVKDKQYYINKSIDDIQKLSKATYKDTRKKHHSKNRSESFPLITDFQFVNKNDLEELQDEVDILDVKSQLFKFTNPSPKVILDALSKRTPKFDINKKWLDSNEKKLTTESKNKTSPNFEIKADNEILPEDSPRDTTELKLQSVDEKIRVLEENLKNDIKTSSRVYESLKSEIKDDNILSLYNSKKSDKEYFSINNLDKKNETGNHPHFSYLNLNSIDNEINPKPSSKNNNPSLETNTYVNTVDESSQNKTPKLPPYLAPKKDVTDSQKKYHSVETMIKSSGLRKEFESNENFVKSVFTFDAKDSKEHTHTNNESDTPVNTIQMRKSTKESVQNYNYSFYKDTNYSIHLPNSNPKCTCNEITTNSEINVDNTSNNLTDNENFKKPDESENLLSKCKNHSDLKSKEEI